MIQLVVEGVFIDLYENDAPKLTLQFDSFETFQPQSAYSQTFRVPATDNNFQFFQTAFEVNGYDFDVTQRREAQILVNGAEFVSGELRLQKIYHSGDNKIDYEVLFMGNTRDFASKLGSDKLNQLDLSELDHTQTMANVETSWGAYPTTIQISAGLKEGNVVYPLVDFGNIYDANELTENVAISVGNSKHITNGDTATLPIADRIWADRFKPIVRAKYLFDKIFNKAGYTYQSEFLGDYDTEPTNDDAKRFWRTYITAWGNEASIYSTTDSNNAKATLSDILTFNGTGEFPLICDTEITDHGNNYSVTTGEYTAPATGTYKFKVKVFGSKTFSGTVSIQILKNGIVQSAYTGVYGLGEEYIIYTKNDIELTVLATQTVSIKVTYNSLISNAVIDEAEITCYESPGDMSIASSLEEEYKQIDFIKDILTMYKLVMVPDRNNPKNFIIEPWSNFIGSGDVLDWTSKLNIDKDIQIEPLFFEQKAELNYSSKEDKDWLNELNQKTFKEQFGDLNVESNNDLLKDTKDIKLTVAPCPVTEMQGANQNTGGGYTNGRDNMVIPHIYQLEAGQTRALRKPIKSKTKYLFYNGYKATGLSPSTQLSWYWRGDSNTNENSTYYPQVTPYEWTSDPFSLSSDENTPSLNLTWQVENGYLQFGTLNPGYSLYDGFWGNYISQIYNKYSRRLTANFILSAEDLINFNFNDVIFVKDTYFYVEKLENVQLGEKQSVKVSLIKLLNYEVPQGGFIPLGDNWEDININWESITDLWETL